ncbi:hypothetical protein [uncultured Fibrella sp.]|uniref:hypothetical protein n=1 Tax=uncultured Fibrella sp. TaxID=1284596 RepID=UPI0035C9D548
MNRHSSTYTLHDPLSLDDLRAYQADKLSGADRHQVERLMLENPFYADALDGLDALQQVGGSLKAQTRDLHLALQERVHESATTRRLMPLWVTSLAASVLLVLSVSIYLIFSNAANQQKATQSVRVSPQPIEPGTVLIDPADLGTSDVVVAKPESLSYAVKSKPQKSLGHLRNAVGKRRLPGTKRSSVVVDDVTPVTKECTFCAHIDDMPLLPHLDLEVPTNRRWVNTERAFLN